MRKYNCELHMLIMTSMWIEGDRLRQLRTQKRFEAEKAFSGSQRARVSAFTKTDKETHPH